MIRVGNCHNAIGSSELKQTQALWQVRSIPHAKSLQRGRHLHGHTSHGSCEELRVTVVESIYTEGPAAMQR